MSQREGLTFRLTSRFVPSIAFAVVLPMVPLVLELLYKGDVDENNYTITAAVLSASLVATSRNIGLALCYGVVAVGVLIVYASSMSGGRPPPLLNHPGFATLTVGMIHCLERFFRHVVKGEPFFEFRV